MVPIIERANYLERISNQPVLRAFQGLLLGRDNTSSGDISTQSETDQIYFGLVRALQKGNQNNFKEDYARISRRTVTKNSTAPFLHNDYLIFVLVTGILKFQLDQAWIKSVMQARTKNRSTHTFEHLLSGDYQSKSSYPEIVFANLKLSEPQKLTKEIQDQAYQAVTQNSTLFTDGNDLITICALYAYDSVILERQPAERVRVDQLINFEQHFTKRSGVVAIILYNIILLSLVYGIWKAANQFPSLKDNAGTISGIVGILGVSLGNFMGKVRNSIKALIMWNWGYKGNGNEPAP